MASGDNNLASPGKNSVERIYQKKTQLEHILLRPDTYIGSVEPVTQSMWVYDEGVGMVNREITYVPGLYKIFDEILVNAADNKQRDKNMSTIKVDIDPENNKISVWNDGKGIPVVEHKVEKLHVPELIFGHLLTSSNYNDTDKKVTGGRNGFGAKLCNIFSTQFTVETSSREYKKKYKQTWSGNMSKAHDKKIISSDKSDYTCITFRPDLSKFHMETLDKDIVALMTRRAYDIAGVTQGVKVYLNGVRLPVKCFKDYVGLYVKVLKDSGETVSITHEKPGERWEVCLTASEKGFQQISFVNSIATTKGGRHVDYVMDQITKKLSEVVKKKNGKGGVEVKPYQVKNHCFVFVNCLIENPTFDSQTKENMTLQAKKFGSKCEFTEKFHKSAANSGIVDAILSWVKFKAQTQLNSKSAKKSSKLKGIPKLDDANDAGTKNSMNCTLILTEGDSAKTLAVSGLSVVGRDKYGVFPLRGKLLNVRDANHKQIMENAEINNIIKIMGLKYGKKYMQEEDLKTLRYGRLMIMTDQDHDGSHIKGLLINFIHSNWPDLIQRRLLEEFITPIVKVTKGSETLSFYTLPEFEDWQQGAERAHTWKVKYYKGLGTSTSKEAKSYFAEMTRHRIRFRYSGTNDDSSIDMAFNKKRSDDRKEWLTNFMEERKRCRAANQMEPGSTLYSVDTKTLSYEDFIHKELVMFSCADLERSVPSFVDGLKPGQRKVLYTCLKRNDKREIKVAQLAGSVAEISAYHHGEVSLQSTIINMAQNYVGSNNLNLLQPIGQFGTRLHGGKDAASPRYIFTMMSPLTKLLFPPIDDNLLDWNYDDNVRVEPQWYCPIIPMILVNGSEGIGTGWSTRVPNHDIREVVANCRRYIRGDDIVPMKASYKGFRGTLDELEPNKYVVSGEIGYIDDNTVEITELPIRTWTQNYKENTLEPLMNGSEKVQAQILEYREYNTDTTVRFVVKLSGQKLREAESKGIHKFFNLQNSFCCNNTLVMFDEFGGLRKYSDTAEILRDFCKIRLRLYGERKEFLVGQLTAESKKLSNQARFILETIEQKISISNKKKKVCLELLHSRGYDSDPVKSWKLSIKKKTEQVTNQANESGDEEIAAEEEAGRDYNYILNMPMISLSLEKKEELLKQRDKKQAELDALLKKTSSDLWKDDLDVFMEELEKVEEKEREDELSSMVNGGGGSGGSKSRKAGGSKKGATGGSSRKGTSGSKQPQVKSETFPSEYATRAEPSIDDQLRARLTAQPSKRVKKEPKSKAAAVKKEPVDMNDMDMDKPPSLMSRIKQTSATKVKKEASVSSSGSGEKKKMKQTKINFKKKGKNPWETSDEEEEKFSDSDVDVDVPPPPKRATSVRSTKKVQKKYKLDDSEEEEEEKFSSDSFDDSPVVAKKKPVAPAPVVVKEEVKEEPAAAPQPKKQKTTTAAAAKPQKKKMVFDDTFSSEEEVVVKKEPKPETKRKATSKSKKETKPQPKKRAKMATQSSDDDVDLSGIDDDSPPPAPRSRPGRTTAKSSKKYTFDDSDESDF